MIKKLELKQELLKNQIISYISEAGGMITDKYKVSYKTQTRESLDTTALKAECEDIYNKYKKISSFRVMRISKNK
jgi:predicted phage-related endonuclease